MTVRTVFNQTRLTDKNGNLALLGIQKRAVRRQTEETNVGGTQVLETDRYNAADYALFGAGGAVGTDPTDAISGTPGFFIPLSADTPANLTDLQGQGLVPSEGDWDTQGQYIVLGDASEAHYRLGVWSAGRVP